MSGELDAEELLALVKVRPAIYNFKMKDHTNRNVIDRLWEEISEEMKVPVSECKYKWTCLRNSYNRVLREARQFSAPGSKRRKRKKWYLFDSMQFINEFVGPYRAAQENSSSSEPLQFADETTNEDDELVHLDLETVDVTKDEQMLQLGLQCNNSMTTSSSQYNIPPPALTPSFQLNTPAQSSTVLARIKPKPLVDSMMIEPAMNYFESGTKSAPKEVESATLTFFRSLVPDVDKLTASRKRKFKQAVMNLLNDELDEQEAG